jgi:enoyl-CoA hydratase/carnithine racemase
MLVTRSNRIGVTTLTIARPPINALDREALEELDHVLQGLERDEQVRAVVLASGVEGIFCAGGDLKYWRQFPNTMAREISRVGRKVFARLQCIPYPTIQSPTGPRSSDSRQGAVQTRYAEIAASGSSRK